MANLNSIFVNDELTRIYWDRSDSSGYVEIEVDDGLNDCFAVYWVPEFGGEALLDSYCNTFSDAIKQLQMVSM